MQPHITLGQGSKLVFLKEDIFSEKDESWIICFCMHIKYIKQIEKQNVCTQNWPLIIIQEAHVFSLAPWDSWNLIDNHANKF